MDSRGRLFVGDRGNNRIQIFDQDGKYLEEWKQFGRPSGIFIDKNDVLYVADHQSDAKTNPGFSKGITIGSARDGKVTARIPDPDQAERLTGRRGRRRKRKRLRVTDGWYGAEEVRAEWLVGNDLSRSAQAQLCATLRTAPWRQRLPPGASALTNIPVPTSVANCHRCDARQPNTLIFSQRVGAASAHEDTEITAHGKRRRADELSAHVDETGD